MISGASNTFSESHDRLPESTSVVTGRGPQAASITAKSVLKTLSFIASDVCTACRSILVALIAIIMSCGSAHGHELAKPVLIAAAADLRFALDEVLLEFKKAHPELEPKATYGSSGTLFAQIDNGAAFDLFLSADVKFPRQLIERGKGVKDSLFVYAIGHLVVWVSKDSKLDVEKLGIRALAGPEVKKVAIANPDVAPYGAAAVAAMKGLGVFDEVQPKLVKGENVGQAAQFVQSGAADAGIISLSLAIAPRMKNEGRYWEVPENAFPKLEQAGVIRVGAANRSGAERFCEFLKSSAGHEILKRYGFVLPEGKK